MIGESQLQSALLPFRRSLAQRITRLVFSRLRKSAKSLPLAATILILWAAPSPIRAATFFDGYGNHARCSALSGWVKRLVRDAGGPSIGDMEMGPELQAKIAPAFQDDIFVPFFGRSFFSLDKEQKRTAQRAFSGCFPGDRVARRLLTIPFNYEERTLGETYLSFMNEIERLRAAKESQASAASNSEATNRAPTARLPNLTIGGDSLLLTTDLYTIYGGMMGCDAEVVLLRDDLTFDEKLQDIARAEIIPAVQKHQSCVRSGGRYGSLSFFWDSTSFFYQNFKDPDTGNYVPRLEMVEPGKDPQLKGERPVYRLHFSQRANEQEWIFTEYFFDYLIYRHGATYRGNPALNSKAMIRSFVADPQRDELAKIWTQKDQEAARELWRQKVEAARQEKLRIARRAHRKLAAPILALLPKSSAKPPSVDFSEYQKGDLMATIYHGQFQTFTGKHEPGDDIEHILKAGSALDDSDGIGSLWYHLAQSTDLARRRAPVTLAFKAYHEAYAANCGSDSSLPWSTLTYQRQMITRNRYGAETSRTQGEPKSVNVRQPFVEAYDEAYRFYIDPGLFVTGAIKPSFAEFSQRLRTDLSRFLLTAGCRSDAVRYFEVNLYLADRWLLPVQELRK